MASLGNGAETREAVILNFAIIYYSLMFVVTLKENLPKYFKIKLFFSLVLFHLLI